MLRYPEERERERASFDCSLNLLLPSSLMAAAAGSPLFLRRLPLLRLQLRNRTTTTIGFLSRPSFCTATDPSQPTKDSVPASTVTKSVLGGKEISKLRVSRWDNPDYCRWRNKETEILKDIEPITLLTKEILHSKRYLDGEQLSAEDEKAVVEKLLKYHPHSEDKIGSGLDSIMVDRHPQFKESRCLFVVRTDGGWIDFSYQKCLRAYIRDKYPADAERFIREHYKRTRS